MPYVPADSCAPRIGTRIWHAAYSSWYDQRERGRDRTAAVLGWLADRLVRWS